MEKPKLKEPYWHIELYDDGYWGIEQSINTLCYMDVYNIANHNCFASFAEAEANAYDLLVALSGEEESVVSFMLYEKRR